MIEVAVRHRLGAFVLDAAFAAEGGLTALFGRSGSGKTSLVNVIAGLIRPEHGRVVVDGETLTDTERGIFVPPKKRRVGYVFQEGRLFPHLTVRQNLLYGRWFAPEGRSAQAKSTMSSSCSASADCSAAARRICRAARSSASRSAGRCWRARACWSWTSRWPRSTRRARPRSCPISSGCATRPGCRSSMSATRSPRSTRLATTMVVLSDGRVAAVGPAAAVMGRLDLFPLTGRAEAGAILATRVAAHDAAFGLTVLRAAAGELRVPHLDMPVGAALRVRIRARDVMIALVAAGGPQRAERAARHRRRDRPIGRRDRRYPARLRRRTADRASDAPLGRTARA